MARAMNDNETDEATPNGSAPDAPKHEPYVPASQSPAEFTIKAALFGILFGIVFGAANAYLGLQAGLTISTSIPVAVMTVAAFRGLGRLGMRSTILEANISQTIGSASSSVASGVIFTLPALFMWGFDPSLVQMTALAMCQEQRIPVLVFDFKKPGNIRRVIEGKPIGTLLHTAGEATPGG